MYVCMYAYINAYMCVCMHVHSYVCMHSICSYTVAITYTHVAMYVYVYNIGGINIWRFVENMDLVRFLFSKITVPQ